MRARLTLVVAFVAAMSVIAVAPIGSGAPNDGPLLWTGNPFVTTVLAQSEPAQEPTPPAPTEDPQPDPVEQAGEAIPVEDAQAAEPAEAAPTPEPEPEAAEAPAAEPEPEPEAEPEPVTLSDVTALLQSAVTAEAANQVTVGAAADALEGARQALADAEQSYAGAMEGQGEHNAAIRAAAQRLVDFVTATYLQ